MVYSGAMPKTSTTLRQTVTLPRPIASRVRSIAKKQRTSANRVIVELIETGLGAREREKRRFFEMAERLTKTSDAAEQTRLKEELARMTFGE